MFFSKCNTFMYWIWKYRNNNLLEALLFYTIFSHSSNSVIIWRYSYQNDFLTDSRRTSIVNELLLTYPVTVASFLRYDCVRCFITTKLHVRKSQELSWWFINIVGHYYSDAPRRCWTNFSEKWLKMCLNLSNARFKRPSAWKTATSNGTSSMIQRNTNM